MKRTFLFLLAFAWAWQVSAQKYVNEFLAIGVGGRALGMSNSQTAISGDANSMYWNPAGLLQLSDQYAGSLMHAAYFNGTANFDYAGFATRLDSASAFGVGLIRFGIDDIPDTRFLFDADGTINYQNVRSFSAADYALLVSYARKLPFWENVRVGGTAKIVHRSVGEFANAWGVGIDLGMQSKFGNWLFGATFRDVTGTYTAWNFNQETFADVFLQTGNTIPESRIETAAPRILTDVARRFPLIKRLKRQDESEVVAGLLISAGAEITFDGERNTLLRTEVASLDPRIGIEGDYMQLVFLRLGAGNVQRIKDFDGSFSTTFRPSFGIGFRLKNWVIDYALTDIGNVDQIESNYSHVFSLKFSLNSKRYKTPRHEAM